jgi:hypothetical protein
MITVHPVDGNMIQVSVAGRPVNEGYIRCMRTTESLLKSDDVIGRVKGGLLLIRDDSLIRIPKEFKIEWSDYKLPPMCNMSKAYQTEHRRQYHIWKKENPLPNVLLSSQKTISIQAAMA